MKSRILRTAPDLLAVLLLSVLLPTALVPGAAADPNPVWQLLESSPTTPSRFEDVFFVDPNIGWTVGYTGRAYRTDNGGLTWTLQREAQAQFRSLAFVDDQRGWIGTLTTMRKLFETTDGGTTWTRVLGLATIGPPGLCGMWAASPDVVYGVGAYYGGASILKTTDGGASWDSLSVGGLATTLIDVRFTSETDGMIVGGIGDWPDSTRARVLTTTDGGLSWTVAHTGSRTREWCWKISFPTPNVGYVSMELFGEETGNFLRTTDGGASWTEMPFLPLEEQAIGFVSETHGWIGGKGTPTHETTDGGVTWNPAGFSTLLNRIRVLSPDLAYASGERIYKYADVAVDITPPLAAEDAFRLRPGAPNPFREATRLRFALDRPGRVSLSVFDVAGRRLRDLTARNLPSGEHSLVWNGEDDAGRAVPAGVYLYVLDVGGRREAGKVVRIRDR